MTHHTSLLVALCLGAAACATNHGDATAAVATSQPVTSSGSTAATVVAPPARPVPPRTAAFLSVAELDEDERVGPSEPLLGAPDEPAIPPAIAPQVSAMQAIVVRTTECWNAPMYSRIAHAAPPDCSEWFAQLAHGGEASAIAIGRHVSDNAHQFNSGPLDQLVEILAKTEARSGVPYLLRRMRSIAAPEARLEQQASQVMAVSNPGWVLERLVYAFERATGFPVNTHGAWASEDQSTAHRSAVQRALRFWEHHGANSGQWAALSDARLRSWLGADGARIIRAATIVHDRAGSTTLVPVARQALERLEATTPDASVRANARTLLAQYRNEGSGPAQPAL
ncbi:MAG: hypothetical protein JNK05_32625 [Myxococcales bacterium]|nr:hypothetical protein [Myxococcales bacterium]